MKGLGVQEGDLIPFVISFTLHVEGHGGLDGGKCLSVRRTCVNQLALCCPIIVLQSCL